LISVKLGLFQAGMPNRSDLKSRSGTGAPSLARTGSRATKRSNSSPRKPTYIDEHVAKRLRLRRALLDISQDELAKRLDVTAQQIQKYEAGETRISASRLYLIAQHLSVPITWFFADLEEKPQSSGSTEAHVEDRVESTDLSDLMTTREARKLVEVYFGIPDARLRRKMLEMADLLKKSEDEV
jgi:transcriptional regulator with XRE-family HTH domain